MLRCLFCLVPLLLLSACASNEEKETDRWDEIELYNAAKSALKRGEFDRAIQRLETLEARYPFGDYAQQGQLDLMYAFYRSARPDDAVSTAKRFIRLNPTHPRRDYVHYLQGVTDFEWDSSIFERWWPRDPAQYEQQVLFSAFYAFDELVRRFPNSDYAPDARQRMVYLRNKLAKSCLNKSLWYEKRKAYVAQVNTAQACIQQFDGSPLLLDTLSSLERAYTSLNMDDLAQQTRDVIIANQ